MALASFRTVLTSEIFKIDIKLLFKNNFPFLPQVEVPPVYPENFTVLHSNPRSLWKMNTESNPEPPAPEIWCATKEPPHLKKLNCFAFIAFSNDVTLT